MKYAVGIYTLIGVIAMVLAFFRSDNDLVIFSILMIILARISAVEMELAKDKRNET